MTGTLLGIACHALPSHWQRPWIACRPHSVFAMPYVMASFVSHARSVPRLGSNVLIFKGSRCDLTGAVLTRPELTRFVLSRPGLSCADLTCPGPLICLLAVLRFLVLHWRLMCWPSIRLDCVTVAFVLTMVHVMVPFVRTATSMLTFTSLDC